MRYSDYLRTPKWKNKRAEFIKITPYCSLCKYDQNLVVHHRNYNNIFNEKPEDVVVLCSACHNMIHQSVKQGVGKNRRAEKELKRRRKQGIDWNVLKRDIYYTQNPGSKQKLKKLYDKKRKRKKLPKWEYNARKIAGKRGWLHNGKRYTKNGAEIV